MRRWFVLALIVLLPLRGWAGDAMAAQMLSQHLDAIKSVASAPVSMGASGHMDCMETAATGDSGAAQPMGADCPTCLQCQVCSSVALALSSAPQLPLPAAFAAPRSADIRFASAEAVRGFKPPIS